MSRGLPLLLIITVLLFLPRFGYAQLVELSPSGRPVASPSPPLDSATEKKALDLLEAVSEQVANFHSAGNHIRASCAIGDLLWTRDEKRARALFAGAVSVLANRIGETDFGDAEGYDEISRLQQWRQDLIMRIAARDPEMALAALQQTRLPISNVRGSWTYQIDTNLEMNLAGWVAAKNPELALKIARATLARGLSWNIVSFIPLLHGKDPRAAQSLYAEVVTRLKNDNPGKNTEAANYAVQLLSSFPPPQADEDVFRDLLTTVLDGITVLDRETQNGIGVAQNFYHQLERVMPMVEKYTPGRAAELRNWAQTVERTLDPSIKMYREMERVNQTGTVDDLLALATRYPPEFQSVLYQNAAWKAFSAGDATRAKEIIDLIPDPLQRRQMLDQIDARNAHAANGDDRLAHARALIEKTRSVNRKIELIIQMAQTLNNNNNKAAALELLGDGKAIVAGIPSSAAQLNAQLRLAQTYAQFSSEEAFAILQPVILRTNELVAAATVLDGIDFRYLKDGEWEMPGANNLGSIVGGIDQTLAQLACSDFDRARRLAEQIERPELRAMISLDLAQVVLGGRHLNNQIFSSRVFSNSRVVVH